MRHSWLVLVWAALLVCRAQTVVFKDQSRLSGELKRQDATIVILQVESWVVPVVPGTIARIEPAAQKAVPPEFSEEEKQNLIRILRQSGKNPDRVLAGLRPFGPRIVPALESLPAPAASFFTPERMLELFSLWGKAVEPELVLRHLKDPGYNEATHALSVFAARGDLACVHIMLRLLLDGILPNPIIQALQEIDEDPRMDVSGIVSEYGKRVTGWNVRHTHFLQGMGKIGRAKSVALLREIAQKSSNPSLVNAAVRALGETGSEEAALALEEMLESDKYHYGEPKNRAMACALIQAMGSTRTRQAEESLMALFEPAGESFRAEIVAALGLNGRESSIPAILEILLRESERPQDARRKKQVMDKCYFALQKITDVRLHSQPWTWKNWWEQRQKNRGELERIYENLDDEEEDVVFGALAELARIREPENASRILPFLDDERPRIRAAACQALGALQNVAHLPQIIELLDDEDAGVARIAHSILQKMRRWQLPPDRETWSAFCEAESSRQPQAMIQLLSHESSLVRKMALQNLALRKDARAIPAVLEVLEKSDLDTKDVEPMDVQMCAMQALKQLHARQAVPSLIEYLESENPRLKTAAHGALRSLTGQSMAADYGAWMDWWEASQAPQDTIW